MCGRIAALPETGGPRGSATRIDTGPIRVSTAPK